MKKANISLYEIVVLLLAIRSLSWTPWLSELEGGLGENPEESVKKTQEKYKKCGLRGKSGIIESIQDKLEERESYKRLL